MTGDLPGATRHFGSKARIHFVHFRDVVGRPEHYRETYHDVGFEAICRPDHVPTMEGDTTDRPGYSSIGRLFAIGYFRGLLQAVYGRE